MLTTKRRQIVTVAVLCFIASFATAHGKSTYINEYIMYT